jgi:hypothetical protein
MFGQNFASAITARSLTCLQPAYEEKTKLITRRKVVTKLVVSFCKQAMKKCVKFHFKFYILGMATMVARNKKNKLW